MSKEPRRSDPSPQLARPISGASIGERIKLRLEAMNMDATEAARRAGMKRPGTIYEWISGRTPQPRIEHLAKLAEVLEMTTDELLGIAEGQQPPFGEWAEFLAKLEERGDELAEGERRALSSFAWPDGTAPTVDGYESLLVVVRKKTRVRN
jgi:transcriptional regulator with XRE-family HTH domain